MAPFFFCLPFRGQRFLRHYRRQVGDVFLCLAIAGDPRFCTEHTYDKRSLLRRPSGQACGGWSARTAAKNVARTVTVCSRRDGGVPAHAVRTWWILLKPAARSEALIMKCSARCGLVAFFKKEGWDSAPRRILQSTADTQTTARTLVHVLFRTTCCTTGGTTGGTTLQ